MLNLFLLTMSLVPCAANVLTFLLMWEGMSLTSYFLVLTETEEPDTILAGGWYLAMTHAGLALVLAAFLLLAAGATDDRLHRSPHRGVRALADDPQRGVPPGDPRLRLQGGNHPAPRLASLAPIRRRRAMSPR